MIFELPTWNWGKINHPNQGEKLNLEFQFQFLNYWPPLSYEYYKLLL